jgi:SRSO17 transposase
VLKNKRSIKRSERASRKEKEQRKKVFRAKSWGLPREAVRSLSQRLQGFHQRYAWCFQTKTRDASHRAFEYVSGLLRMTSERNFATIGRMTHSAEQNMHHFMSNSPWSGRDVLLQVRAEIQAVAEFQAGGMLLLDESADEKASDKSVGAGKQHNGRLGKVETSQVGTFLAYVNQNVWTWIDAELFLPAAWFNRKKAALCKKLGVPRERKFATKIELGYQMIERVAAEGFPFEAVGFDALYGRSLWLRRKLWEASITYMGDIPEDTRVYLTEPEYGLPQSKTGKKPYTRRRVLCEDKGVEVRSLVRHLEFNPVRVRAVERGFLCNEFARLRVWTAKDEYEPREETLLVRRDAEGKLHYALSNAAASTPIEKLAWMKCARHFIERSNQDAKSELGYADFRAQKYLAWEHHLALTVLASWFIAQTQHEWQLKYERDDSLKAEFESEVLPRLSMANVREMLRAAMPLPQLTPDEATNLVVRHLVNRARSRKSRIKHANYRMSPS